MKSLEFSRKMRVGTFPIWKFQKRGMQIHAEFKEKGAEKQKNFRMETFPIVRAADTPPGTRRGDFPGLQFRETMLR